jgi:hypothetical protein
MWKKVLVVGTTTAAIVGAGTAALAVTGNTPTPTPSTSASHAKARAGAGSELRRALHATWTTKTKGGFVTHDAIRGTITAVTPSSLTVKAADGVTETYAVTSTTIEHLSSDGKSKGTAGRIAQVHVGDRAGVFGTGTTTKTATHIIDVGTGTAAAATTAS